MGKIITHGGEQKSRVKLPLKMNKNNKIYDVDLAVEAPELGGQ